MNIQAQQFIEELQERLSDAHSKHEDSVDQLARWVDNLELNDEQLEKLEELMFKVYSTLEDIKFQII